MALLSGLALYFILWWVVLFAVLPWGADSAHELGETAQQGHAASAPIKPNIGRKFLATTLISAAIFSVGYLVVVYRLITLDDIPFLPDFKS